MKDRPRILVVAGPTATGKTAAAIDLARRFGGELVGADSVQVYRGFDIGSAKPTAEELGGVAHHLIDVIDPDEAIDAVRYAGMADRAIAEIAARGSLPIVAGGTGLWLRALVRGLVELPPVDAALRARLEAEADAIGSPAMHARLASLDPGAAAAIHPNDRLRIVRALEIHEQTGMRASELRARHALGAPRYPALFVALDVPRAEARARIEARTRAMIDRGLEDEVRALVARFGPSVRAFGSVGYRQMLERVTEGVPLDETIRRIDKATRVYARRQRTWLASEPGIDLRTDAATLVGPDGAARIEAFLR